MNADTIFALSSGHGKSGVAVIRVSGDNLRDAFLSMTGRASIGARHAYLANLRDVHGDVIDQVLMLYFSAPNSFTGEDVIEIHCHGAAAVIEKIFDDLRARGARMAVPGEFSRRAFYNDKMDLTDVDGLAALLDAKTDAQRKSALRSMMGGDAKIYDAWRARMIEISAYAAAMTDYADDELPANIGEKIRVAASALCDEINTALSRYAAVRAVRGGFNITLAGRPNVGKSSIFNRIVGANRAIVSDTPGTTRDVVGATIDIDGFMVNISDTAGLRDDASDAIEKIGIEKTHDEIENADLVLRVYDENVDVCVGTNEMLVVNKSDLISEKNIPGAVYVSAKTGAGIDNLLCAIAGRMHEMLDGADGALAINVRTRGLLEMAADELKSAVLSPRDDYDIFAEHTRRASDAIGKILGTITAAEVMDATFSQLCLGK